MTPSTEIRELVSRLDKAAPTIPPHEWEQVVALLLCIAARVREMEIDLAARVARERAAAGMGKVIPLRRL
ncbi:hypothetical protein [Tistrella mobilis]|uniref:Uncharacterized protein n=1 Tax=Tistrella mobilis (strain KA081020-065) TaxID=1110502 RepID=I3TN99_TISMK|nr:hypothetical protein [Tistrella mobilis]AFK54237.1 hypothetical protein TMO_2399 [Tistrella mobilis KA081020-065]